MESLEYKTELDESSLNFSKKLMCIEYPGMVNNIEKMIQTLGGMQNLGIVYGTKNRRVELRFRPDDIYCKPACSDRQATTSLLMKIKIKKKFRNTDTPCSSKNADVLQSITYTVSVIGVVDTVYKFNNLCDFQYLPMDFKKGESPGGKIENIYDRLRPNFLPNSVWLNKDNVSLFLTPPVFSRFDTVHYYSAQKTKDPNPYADSRTIGRTRKIRKGYAMFLSFKDENVPQKPKLEALKMLHVKFLNQTPYEQIIKLFEERPIWSKNALQYRTHYSKEQLKYLLPTVAYYFLTGPWRVMWIKYGYDPRIDPESKIYQTFDYRMRTTGGLKNKVKAKRSYSHYLLPYKNTHASRPRVPIITRHTLAKAYQEAQETSTKETLDENLYIFRPGMIPPFRQMFYQYCDVQIPEIQTILNRETPPDAKCDPRAGWLPTDFDSHCREIVSNLVATEIKKQIQDQQRLKRKQEQIENAINEECDEDDSMEEDTENKETEDTNVEIEISDSEDSEESDFIMESDGESEAAIDSDLEESLKESL